ncbi:hypothetical protein WD019_19120 [Fictibacillus sp. Mic-4]|uniref:hypothetical protein n=1 Tax=Fictibacillus TaxID=1329200 RepID=UPI0004155852|nr:hypothetical protein [Fictibacillus gelatini]HAJ3957205.1 hypothetical protein [Escherichia coli]
MEKAKWCAYCGHLHALTKTIERPNSYIKSFGKYIHVCLSCIKKHRLEHLPEYTPSELQKFVDGMRMNAIVPTILMSENGEEYLTFHNGQGTLLSTKQMEFIANELLKTIKLNGLDEFIEEENQDNYMSRRFLSDPENKDKYLVPFEGLNIKRKRFNINKVWGFTCGNCSKKMSSKDGGDYFTISPNWPFTGKTERACSEGCIKVIAKERIIDWIYSSSFQRYFDLEKLDERLIEFIKGERQTLRKF